MKPASKRTALTLANSIEVCTGVVHEISGSATAKTLNGHHATRAALSDLVASRIHAKFAKHTNKGVK